MQVTYSIDGCIRNFKMTESPIDLDNPTSSFSVGKCFVTAQKGTYFDGTGFAKTGNSDFANRERTKEKKEMLFSKHSVLLPGSKVRPVLKEYHLELSITLPKDRIHDFLSKASFSVQPPLSFLTFHMKWSALIVLHYGGQLSCITPATHCVIIRNNVTMFLFTSLFLPFSLQVGAYKVGTDLLVEFEFRTTQVNGVLLGVSSQKMDGLGIELVDGKVSSQAALTPYNGS